MNARNTIETLAQKYVDVQDNGCWDWLGYRYKNGYGCATFNGDSHLAHRIFYKELIGEIPEGLDLDHLCRNRACVNPAHLEPATRRVNLLRGPTTLIAINAAKTHCPKGHPLSGDNLVVDNGKRKCRECKNDRQRVAWHLKKGD